jgi:hypothetical protein
MADMDDKNLELNAVAVAELSSEGLPAGVGSKEDGNRDDQEMAYYGKQQQLKVRIHHHQLSYEVLKPDGCCSLMDGILNCSELEQADILTMPTVFLSLK